MDVKSAISELFGAQGGAETFFYAGLSERPSPAQETARVTIDSHRREINRLRGYKPVLTSTEQARLREIQEQVLAIERKAGQGIVRADELEDRRELLREADIIIGKPVVDVEADEELAGLATLMETLLAPKLNPAQEKRVSRLERMRDNIELQFNQNPKSATLRAQFQNLVAQIDSILVPRKITELSPAEVRAYDDLVNLINEKAGAKIELQSRDAKRVLELERSILQMQDLLPPDASQQPTPQSVANAYVSLAL